MLEVFIKLIRKVQTVRLQYFQYLAVHVLFVPVAREGKEDEMHLSTRIRSPFFPHEGDFKRILLRRLESRKLKMEFLSKK